MQGHKDMVPKQVKAKVMKGHTTFQCAGTPFTVQDKYEYIK